jgi:predicted ATPase
MEQPIFAFRLCNFMGFKDTDWLELRKLNLLFGQNSSGKSAIIRALLLLKQSVDAPPEFGPLMVSAEEGADVGSYADWVFQHDTNLDVTFWFRLDMQAELKELEGSPDPLEDVETFLWGYEIDVVSPWVDLGLTFGVTAEDRKTVRLKSLTLQGEVKLKDIKTEVDKVEQATIFSAVWQPDSEWLYDSEIDLNKDHPDLSLNREQWQAIVPVCQRGFVPVLRPPDLVDEGEFLASLGEEATDFFLLNRILVTSRNRITEFFHSMVYLGPIRHEPQRYYYVPQLAQGNIGKHGEYIVKAYLSAKKQQLQQIDKLNLWLKHMGLNCELIVLPLDKEHSLYGIYLREMAEDQTSNKYSLSVNLRDVGFGISQSLPVIIAAILAEPGSLIVIEQPELHLHPRAQARLADLFVDAVYTTNSLTPGDGVQIEREVSSIRFLLETHSQDLLLRIRRRIAESSAGKHHATTAPNLYLESDDVSIYFVHRKPDEKASSITEIPLSNFGDFETKPTGFEGFFSNDLQELRAITAAKLNAPE